MHVAEQDPCVHVEIREQLNGNLFFSFHCVDVGAGLRSSDVTIDAFTLNHVPGGWSIFLIYKKYFTVSINAGETPCTSCAKTQSEFRFRGCRTSK